MTTEKERRRKGFSRVAPRVFDWEEGGGRDSYLQPHEMGDDCCRSQEGGGMLSGPVCHVNTRAPCRAFTKRRRAHIWKNRQSWTGRNPVPPLLVPLAFLLHWAWDDVRGFSSPPPLCCKLPLFAIGKRAAVFVSFDPISPSHRRRRGGMARRKGE